MIIMKAEKLIIMKATTEEMIIMKATTRELIIMKATTEDGTIHQGGSLPRGK